MAESRNKLGTMLKGSPSGLGRLTQRTEGRDLSLESNQEAKIIPLERIVSNPHNPRRSLDLDSESFKDLVADIGARGVLQPIIVVPLANGTYQVVAGERRFQASKQADKADIPAIIKSDMDERETRYVSLVENLQRQDLAAADEGAYFVMLTTEFNLSVRDIADMIHKSHGYVQSRIEATKPKPEAKTEVGGAPEDSDKSNKRPKNGQSLQNTQSSQSVLTKTALSRAVAGFRVVAERAAVALPQMRDDEKAVLDDDLAALEELVLAIRERLTE